MLNKIIHYGGWNFKYMLPTNFKIECFKQICL